jgi:hypothetical protein
LQVRKVCEFWAKLGNAPEATKSTNAKHFRKAILLVCGALVRTLGTRSLP